MNVLFLFFIICCAALQGCNARAGVSMAAGTAGDSIRVCDGEGDIVDQSAGMEVIARLSRAYGDAADVVGGFIGSSRCPEWLEGMYFDGAELVMQVTCDTVEARRALEEAAGVGTFRLERTDSGHPSQKQLKELIMCMRRRLAACGDTLLQSNVVGNGVGLRTINVTMIVCNAEWQRRFRTEVMDSPLLEFHGSTGDEPCALSGTSDTLGVALVAEPGVLPVTAGAVRLVMSNDSGVGVEFGQSHVLAYERDGRWLVLPGNPNSNLLLLEVEPGDTCVMKADLYPGLNRNRPSRYRYFKEVEIGGEAVTLMAEFRLQ